MNTPKRMFATPQEAERKMTATQKNKWSRLKKVGYRLCRFFEEGDVAVCFKQVPIGGYGELETVTRRIRPTA